jgi:glycosyltransferase involved in cell wall biosynthesis
MPVHNRADIFLLFEKAVLSVFENSVIPNEMVLVVDGPLDHQFHMIVIDLAERFPLRVIWLEKNLGLTEALNIGLDSIQTAWVMRADADDINLSNRFELQLQALDSGFDLVGGGIEEVDILGQFIALKLCPLSSDEILQYIKFRNPFNHMTVAFSTAIAKSLGGYPGISFKEDYALWALFLSSGAKVMNLKEVLVQATTGKAMYARRGGLKAILSEINLQKFLISCGLQSTFFGLTIGAIRVFLLMLPTSLLSIFYIKFLRNFNSIRKAS